MENLMEEDTVVPPSSHPSRVSAPAAAVTRMNVGMQEEGEENRHGEGTDMDMDDGEEQQQQMPRIVKPKGSYRLSDFIIQRTLGTGSFGRVHLGAYHNSTYSQFFFFSPSSHPFVFCGIGVVC